VELIKIERKTLVINQINVHDRVAPLHNVPLLGTVSAAARAYRYARA